uniref:Chaperone DnaJ C-terminal domain-containing protein n=1 Tax=Megaselia scalaris TaxID=36166 RepID=T1GE02_MEGSC
MGGLCRTARNRELSLLGLLTSDVNPRDRIKKEIPYGNLIDAVIDPPPLYSCKGIGVKTKGPDVVKVVRLDLQEIFHGATKRMQVLRQEFSNDEESKTECREKVINIKIPPGTLPNTSFRYKEEGDRHPTKIPGDVVFITADKPHPIYTRDGPHLNMTKKIDLAKALCGFKFFVETIDQKKLLIAISDVIYPGYVKEMLGEGLPIVHEPSLRGSFNIFFHTVRQPLTLTIEGNRYAASDKQKYPEEVLARYICNFSSPVVSYWQQPPTYPQKLIHSLRSEKYFANAQMKVEPRTYSEAVIDWIEGANSFRNIVWKTARLQ